MIRAQSQTNNLLRLKFNDTVLLEEDQPRTKQQKGKIVKLIYGIENLVQHLELLTTQKLKRKIEKIRRPLQMIVPLQLCNSFNNNSDNNDKNNNNDNDENDNVSSDSFTIQMIYYAKLTYKKRKHPNKLQRLTPILYAD